MTKFADELKELLLTEEAIEYGGCLACDFFYEEASKESRWYTPPESLASIEWEYLDHYCGMDQGSDYWTVVKFTRGDEECILKFDGWYASHDGSHFEKIFEVKPQQKTVTVYE